MIEAFGLSKRFGKIHAAREVSFAARDGEITGLLGANGAGKSTCLRMLYGVLTPDSGKASIDGIDILGETSKARAHLGVLPHAAGLYNHLSARENIEYFGALHGMRKQDSRARIAELTRTLDMESFTELKKAIALERPCEINKDLKETVAKIGLVLTSSFLCCSREGIYGEIVPDMSQVIEPQPH